MNTQSTALEKISGDLITKMHARLHALERETPGDLNYIRRSRQIVYDILHELREAILSNPAMDIAHEIEFFRRIKPSFTRPYIYFKKLYEIKFNEPLLQEDRKKYIESQLFQLESFRHQNQLFYEYCLSADTHFDIQYFSRQSNFQDPNVDRNFSTGYDSLYATLLANEDLKNYLLLQLQAPVNSNPQTALTWTAPKAALIELIYALKATDVFNHGNADIKQITTAMESLFQISLGNYYRVYQDIRLRKSGQTNFLDLLKEKFISRISELD